MDQCIPKVKPSLPPKPDSLTFKNKCKSLSSYHIVTKTARTLSSKEGQVTSSDVTPSPEDIFNNNSTTSKGLHEGITESHSKNFSNTKSSLALPLALQPKFPKDKPSVPSKFLYRSGGTVKVMRTTTPQSLNSRNFNVEKLRATFEEFQTGQRVNSTSFIPDDYFERSISFTSPSDTLASHFDVFDEVEGENDAKQSSDAKSIDNNNNDNHNNNNNDKLDNDDDDENFAKNKDTLETNLKKNKSKHNLMFPSPSLARISIKRPKPRIHLPKVNTLPYNTSFNPSSDKTTTKFPSNVSTTIITTTSKRTSPKLSQINNNLDVLIPIVTDSSASSRSSRRSGRKSKVQSRAQSENRDKLSPEMAGELVMSLVELNNPENPTSTFSPKVERPLKQNHVTPLYLSMGALSSRHFVSSCCDLNQQAKYGRVEELINECLGAERTKQTGTLPLLPPKPTNPISPTSSSLSSIFSTSMKSQETADVQHLHDDKRKSGGSDSSNDNYGTLSDDGGDDDDYIKREDMEEQTPENVSDDREKDSIIQCSPNSDYLPLFGDRSSQLTVVAATTDDALSYCSSGFDDKRVSVALSIDESNNEIKMLTLSSASFVSSSFDSRCGGLSSLMSSSFISSSNSSSTVSLNHSFSFGARSNSIDIVSHPSSRRLPTDGENVVFEGGESLEGRLNKSDSLISCPQFGQLPKRPNKDPFLVAKEIMTSEEKFIGVLTLLNEKFPEFIQLERAQGRAMDGPSDVKQLFHDLPDLQKVNKELLEQLKKRIENWDKDPRIADIFVKTGHFLKMYTNYIKNFSHVVQEFDATRKKCPEFDKSSSEFENLPSCNKLALRHFMLKPIQRIPQYKLLLQEYLKCLSPNSPDYQNTKDAIPIVAGVSEHANESVRYWENQCKMINIQSMLNGFQLIKPGRIFIKEGRLMKLSRKEMQARMFFLFNDLLLYTTPLSANSFKVNQAISLDGLTVNCSTTEDIENEFSIISVERSFTVAASSKEEREQWVTALELAVLEDMETKANLVEALEQRRITSSLGPSRSVYLSKTFKTRSVIVGNGVSSMYETSFKIGDRAPVWIQDDRVSMCMACLREFSVTFRRHHCRGCGKIVCSNCSKGRAPLKYNGFKLARVCIECYEHLTNDITCDVVGDQNSSMAEDGESRKDSTLPSTPSTSKKTFLFKGRNSITRSISKPSILTEVQAFDSNSEMCGFLLQLEKKKWRRFWFVLKGKVLYTFRAMQDKAAMRTMPLLSYNVQDGSSGVDNDEKMFELFHDGLQPVTLRAETCALKLKWIEALQKAMTV